MFAYQGFLPHFPIVWFVSTIVDLNPSVQDKETDEQIDVQRWEDAVSRQGITKIKPEWTLQVVGMQGVWPVLLNVLLGQATTTHSLFVGGFM